jgi:hypothetical protein
MDKVEKKGKLSMSHTASEPFSDDKIFTYSVQRHFKMSSLNSPFIFQSNFTFVELFTTLHFLTTNTKSMYYYRKIW